MPVTKRIENLRERLKSFTTITDTSTDDWRSKTESFYSDLRQTWERLVEEVMLGKTIERFSSEVKTQNLKEVVVDDTDYKTIFFAMKRASERSGHDMATGRNVPVPIIADMTRDLNELEAFRTAADKRRKETSARRKGMEEPPQAEVA